MKVELKGKEYDVRGLEFDDTFRLAEILDKIGFDPQEFQTDLKSLGIDKKDEGSTQQAGMMIAVKIGFHILRKSYHAKKEFREFLASLIGVKPQEMGQLPIDAPFKIFKALAEEHDLGDFFKQAAG